MPAARSCRNRCACCPEGVADFATIDRILVDAAGFRIGPFGLMDLVGLDVAHAVMKSMYEQYFEEPKYRPSVHRRAAGGGRIARPQDEARLVRIRARLQMPSEPAAPKAKPSSVWAVPELKELLADLGAKLEPKPSPDAICFVAPLGLDASAAAQEHGLDATRTVAVDPFFGFSKRRTLMVTPIPARTSASRPMDCWPATVCGVRHQRPPGFVAQRVVAHIVNVGCDIVQMRIATPEDLDRAVTLGLGYPKGRLPWGCARRETDFTCCRHAYALPGPRYRPSHGCGAGTARRVAPNTGELIMRMPCHVRCLFV